MIESEREEFISTEKALIKVLEPMVIRSILAGDFADMYATLKLNKKNNPHWVYLEFVNSSGKRIYPLISPPLPKGKYLIEIHHRVNLMNEDLGEIFLISDLEEKMELFLEYQRNFEIIILLIFGSILFVAVILQAYWVHRPIRLLQKATHNLAQGDFNVSLPKPRTDELGLLTGSFLKMKNNLLSTQQDLKLSLEDAEKAREEAVNANNAKSIFLANMSHEIRTPMNAILGYSQILLRKKELDQDTKDALRTINNSGQNLLTLINEILDISKIEAGKVELNSTVFDLQEFVDGLSSMFEIRCQQKHLNWKVKINSGQELVHGDEGKLRQVLINIIGNAIKFTESGEVSFSVTALEQNQYLFDIIDTGNGIPVEAQDKIFQPFQQDAEGSKKGGTGLGLAISNKFLELMGADLKLKSKLNEGAHFYFTLTLPPAAETGDRRTKYGTVSHLASPCKIKALVVDDVKENREVLSKLLSSIGVEVINATNGKEGVEKTREHHPDIVFMDIRMPVMRGEEAAKLIQEEFGYDRIKLVSITASALDLGRQHFLDLGFHEYISKPFKEEDIFNSLKELLNVDFVYEDESSDPVKIERTEDQDVSGISLPEKLVIKMKNAANLYNVTEVERGIAEISALDGDTKELVPYLQRLLKNYDMDEILKVLEKVSLIED